jgi:Holliday junction resolvase RusA-like endonuclease|tara:strand:+ start:754 stop:1122 length:369 start_codon:yes stop_codon:yes gene_type:complete
MKMTLPLAPSQNQLLRMHWAKRKKIQKDFEWSIVQAVGNRSSALCSVHITITRKSVGVEPDPDNLTASAKLILDALQRVGVIKDDSPKYITLRVQWEQAKKRVEQETVVTIEKWDLDKVQDH